MKREFPIFLMVAMVPLFTSCMVKRWIFPEPVQPVAVQAHGPLDSRIAGSVNAYRATKGLPPLQRDTRLDAMARQHSAYMMRHRAKNLVNHDGFSGRLNQAVREYGMRGLSENAGAGSGSSAVPGILRMWIDSRPHRTSMIGTWDCTGVGTAVDRDGMIFVTQIFGRR